MEPTQIISALSKSKDFQKRALHSICASRSCNKKINDILSMVEDGSTDVVESFVAALKDLGYWDIVALIDPPDVHRRAGKYCLNRLLKLSYCLLLFLIYFNMIEIYLKKTRFARRSTVKYLFLAGSF